LRLRRQVSFALSRRRQRGNIEENQCRIEISRQEPHTGSIISNTC